jgi:hypothetical protein
MPVQRKTDVSDKRGTSADCSMGCTLNNTAVPPRCQDFFAIRTPGPQMGATNDGPGAPAPEQGENSVIAVREQLESTYSEPGQAEHGDRTAVLPFQPRNESNQRVQGHHGVYAAFMRATEAYDGQNSSHTPYAYVALAAALNHADWQTGRFSLSARQVSKVGQCSPNSAKAALKLLQELGVIRFMRKGGFDKSTGKNRANEYVLTERYRPRGVGQEVTTGESGDGGGVGQEVTTNQVHHQSISNSKVCSDMEGVRTASKSHEEPLLSTPDLGDKQSAVVERMLAVDLQPHMTRLFPEISDELRDHIRAMCEADADSNLYGRKSPARPWMNALTRLQKESPDDVAAALAYQLKQAQYKMLQNPAQYLINILEQRSWERQNENRNINSAATQEPMDWVEDVT